MMRQWLQEYDGPAPTEPYENICTRQFRFEGFDKWKVHLLMKVPPFLLQVALLLFFIGIPIFLWSVDRIVAYFTMGILIVWFSLWSFVIVLATLNNKCPYKSAEASMLSAFLSIFSPQKFTEWRDNERNLVKELAVVLGWSFITRLKDRFMDQLVLARALYAYLGEVHREQNDKVIDVLWPRVQEVTRVQEKQCWYWIPEVVTTELMGAWMIACASAVKASIPDHQTEQYSHLIVLLVKYSISKRKDADSQEVIQTIDAVFRELTSNTLSFPYKDNFQEWMSHGFMELEPREIYVTLFFLNSC